MSSGAAMAIQVAFECNLVFGVGGQINTDESEDSQKLHQSRRERQPAFFFACKKAHQA